MRNVIGMVCLGALALALGGCGKKTDIKLAETAYARGNYASSDQLFKSHTGAFDPNKDEARFYAALSRFNAGDNQGAYAELKNLEGTGNRTLRARVLDAEAKICLKTSNPGEAERLYQNILNDYTKYYPEEDALGGLMKAKTAKGDTVGAATVRQELAAKYPGSPYLGAAGGGSTAGGKPASAGTVYRVRLSKSFADRSGAQAEVARLKQKGVDCALVALPKGGFGVQAGAYSSQQNASAAVEKLRAKGVSATVVAG